MSIGRVSGLLVTAAILCLLVAPAPAAEKAKTYGAGVKLESSVSILKLLDDPESYVGKPVRVEGTVGDVCPRMGCWIDVLDKNGDRHVRVKVDDGEIVFPLEAKGQRVVAEGVFEKIEMSEQDALAWARHLAEEKGEPFDETAEFPTVIYRIRGTGAVIR